MKKTHTIIVDTNKITFPDDTEQTTKAVRSATLVVAANDSEVKSKAQADYVCDGTDDHLEIQAAIDALPATGGEVFLLEGTYYVEVSLVLDSYQTLRGCGRNTILTTMTADIDIITATGGAGTELVGILIADLCIDGNAGGVANDIGILWTYVDYSKIEGVWSQNNGEDGMQLINCDFNIISANTCQGNSSEGIYLRYSNNNTISANTFRGNGSNSIYLRDSNSNTVVGNNDQGSGSDDIFLYVSDNNIISNNNIQWALGEGISLIEADNNTISSNNIQWCWSNGIILYDSDNNNVTGNTCRGNRLMGIYLEESDNNTISANTCLVNSQAADITSDNITLNGNSDYNLIEGNLCRAPTIGTTLTIGESAGATDIRVTAITGFEVGMGVAIDLDGLGGGTECHRIVAVAPGVITIAVGLINDQGIGETVDVPEARYGINIVSAFCNKNVVINNDLYDAGKTANFYDVGTETRLNVYVVPFSHGSDPQDSGYEIDLADEFARAWLRLPLEVQQVVRMKIYARAVILSAAAMRLEINVNGGADNEAFDTHPTAAPDTPSTSTNFAADDVIFWTLTSAQIIALLGGDSVEVKVLHEAAGGGDVVTDAFFRTVEFEYV